MKDEPHYLDLHCGRVEIRDVDFPKGKAMDSSYEAMWSRTIAECDELREALADLLDAESRAVGDERFRVHRWKDAIEKAERLLGRKT